MELLATADDLRNYLGVEKVDIARADFLLGAISSEIRKFSGLTFEEHVDDVVRLDGSGTGIVLLPRLPVSDVKTVVEGGAELDQSVYEWNADGILRKPFGYWVQRFRNIVVTYSHGFEEVPEDIRLLVVRVASRAWTNPTQVTNEGAAGYTVGYGFDTSRVAALTDADKQYLRENYMGR